MSTSPTPTLSAHAARNPSKPVQPPRQRARKSDAGASTQAVNDAKLKNEEMFAEVDAFQELRHEKVKELAIKYEKDEAFFLKLLAHGGRYSGTRGTTLWNAFKHDLSRQARESGESKSTIELNKEAKEKYEEFKKSLTEDEKKEFIAQLEDHRELQHKGVCATNKSAGADAMQNAVQMGRIMRDMYERTGVRCLAFFTRGNPNDASLPHIEDSGGSRRFCIEALEMDEYDFVRAFERWACQQDAGGPKQNHKLTVIQKEVSEMLNGGLRKVKNDDSLSMEYVNYRVDIVHKLGVELAGWPAWVEMARASKLSAENARDIHQKLKSGAIHWVALTRSQRDAVAEEIKERRAQGPLKPRKQRSDKAMEREKTSKKKSSQHEDAPPASSATPTGTVPSSVVNTTVPSVANAVGASIVNAAVASAANGAILSAAKGAIPFTKAAVASAANGTVLSAANVAVPFTNAAVPSAVNGAVTAAANGAVPSTVNGAVLSASNVAVPTANAVPSIADGPPAPLDLSFFDTFTNFDPTFDPRQFDYTALDLSLSSLPPLPEDAALFPDVRLNTRNVSDGAELRDEPAGALLTHLSVPATTPGPSSSGSATHVFSANVGTNDGNVRKRRRGRDGGTADNGAAPAAKKPRKTRSDAGTPHGPQIRARVQSSGRPKRPRKKRSDAGVPRGPAE
ncbi:hypothetical protein C8R45DRAFT_943726 [Mycena sanguinolenta]|nr:hypothetical protein C8R45DRAFT_943726 [Mycena sanguinolenta]